MSIGVSFSSTRCFYHIVTVMAVRTLLLYCSTSPQHLASDVPLPCYRLVLPHRHAVYAAIRFTHDLGKRQWPVSNEQKVEDALLHERRD
jgi:hypothetical protein